MTSHERETYDHFVDGTPVPDDHEPEPDGFAMLKALDAWDNALRKAAQRIDFAAAHADPVDIDF